MELAVPLEAGLKSFEPLSRLPGSDAHERTSTQYGVAHPVQGKGPEVGQDGTRSAGRERDSSSLRAALICSGTHLPSLLRNHSGHRGFLMLTVLG